jgi:hypothetical protein
VAQCVGPEFKPQYYRKKETERERRKKERKEGERERERGREKEGRKEENAKRLVPFAFHNVPCRIPSCW